MCRRTTRLTHHLDWTTARAVKSVVEKEHRTVLLQWLMESRIRGLLLLMLVTLAGVALIRAVPSEAETVVWTRQFGSAGRDLAWMVGVDAGGNVYTSGSTNGSLAGPNLGSYDAFVRKYDPSGVELWTRQFGTFDDDEVDRVAVDRAGRVYVTGRTRANLSGTNLGPPDVFVRKYDANGTELWTRQFGTSVQDIAMGVAGNGQGDVYVSGRTEGSLFGASNGSFDAFLMKLFDVAPGADLAVAIADSPDPGTPGTNVTLAVTVVNNGPLSATGVALTVTLPNGPSFISAAASQGT
jgi:uncharacterized repeat protein (TIGR01451 family)